MRPRHVGTCLIDGAAFPCAPVRLWVAVAQRQGELGTRQHRTVRSSEPGAFLASRCPPGSHSQGRMSAPTGGPALDLHLLPSEHMLQKLDRRYVIWHEI